MLVGRNPDTGRTFLGYVGRYICNWLEWVVGINPDTGGKFWGYVVSFFVICEKCGSEEIQTHVESSGATLGISL